MKTMQIFLGTFLLLSSVANANIVCRGKASVGKVKIEFTDDSEAVITSPALSKPRMITGLSNASGLMTTHGFAFFYEDDYGCIHNAIVIGEFNKLVGAGYMEKVEVQCTGGQTPDRVCFP